MKQRMFDFFATTVLMVLSAGIIQIDLCAQTITTEKLAVRLIHFGHAAIEPIEEGYQGKPLTGVIVEITSSAPNAVARLEGSSVAAQSTDGKPIPAVAMFIAGGDEDVIKGTVIGGTSLAGWNITIGKDKFEAWGSPAKMVVLLKSGGGGVEYTFEKKGILKIGFIFPEGLEKLKNVSLLGKTLKLEQQTGGVISNSREKEATGKPTLPEPFVIKDDSFIDRSLAHNDGDVQFFPADKGQLRFEGKITMSMGTGGLKPILWADGVRHTWNGKLEVRGYTFDSDKVDPLQFQIDKEQGYVYFKGKGTVTFPDGKVVKLPLTKASVSKEK